MDLRPNSGSTGGSGGEPMSSADAFPAGSTGVARLSLQSPLLVVTDDGPQTVVLDLGTLL